MVKKLAIISFRHPFGQAVSTHLTELTMDLEKRNDIKFKLYIADDRPTSYTGRRQKYYFDKFAIKFKLSSAKESSDIFKEINVWANKVLISAWPNSTGKGNPVMDVDRNIRLFLETTPVPVMGLTEQRNLESGNKRYFNIAEYSFLLDGLFTYTGPYHAHAQHIHRGQPGIHFEKWKMGFNIKRHFSKFNVPFEDRKYDIAFFGRWANSKNPKALLKMAPYLIEKGVNVSLWGMTRMFPGQAEQMYGHPTVWSTKIKAFTSDGILRFNSPEYDYFNKDKDPNKCVHIFGSYEREIGLELMSQCKLVVNLCDWGDAESHGDSLENVNYEGIMAGAVSVENKNMIEYHQASGFQHLVNCLAVDINDWKKYADNLILACKDKKFWCQLKLLGYTNMIKTAEIKEVNDYRIQKIFSLNKIQKIPIDKCLINYFTGYYFEDNKNKYMLERTDGEYIVNKIRNIERNFNCKADCNFIGLNNMLKNKYLIFRDNSNKVVKKYNFKRGIK